MTEPNKKSLTQELEELSIKLLNPPEDLSYEELQSLKIKKEELWQRIAKFEVIEYLLHKDNE